MARVTLLLSILFMMHSSYASSQNIKNVQISINQKDATLVEVFNQISNITKFNFTYSNSIYEKDEKFDAVYKKQSLEYVLIDLGKRAGFTFKVKNKDIMIAKAPLKVGFINSKFQENIITGIVSDVNGTPLIGASVIEKGSSNGVITDFDGKFEIEVKNENPVLEISFLGFIKQDIEVGNQTEFEIVLKEDESKLDEVVVIGYGKQNRRDVTGSIGSVKTDSIDKTSFTSTEQLLQGRIAGVQLSNVSGNPGGQQRVNIRGIGSLQGDNQPLYVIDGIPVSNTDPSQTPLAKFGQGNLTNPLALINPNDIESIEVLKDASAAAIYGSRATNGVILITTKKGKKGKSRISFNIYRGLQSLPKEIDVASTEQYLLIVNEARSNFNNQNGFSPNQVGFLDPIFDPRDPNQKDTDWIGTITNDVSPITDVGISLSGGDEKTKLFTSIGYFDQEGIIKTSRFRRLSTILNIEHKISPSLTLRNNLIGSYSVNNRVVSHGGISLLSDTREQRPFDTPYDDDGNYNVGGSPDLLRNNGIRGINESKSRYKSYRLINNINLEYKTPIKGLTYIGTVGVDVGLYHDYLFWTPNFRFAVGDGGQLVDSRNIATKSVINNQFIYKNTLGKLNYEITAIHAFEKFKLDRTFIEAIGFPFESNGSLATATSVRTSTFRTPPGVGNAIGENALESFIGRATLEYDNKYLLNLAIRRDGSSQFAEGKKYGDFPSISAGWRFTNEDFYSKNEILNDGKIRLSYGTTGSVNGVNDFASLPLVSGGFSYDGEQGAIVTQVGNDLLTWEKSSQFNVGTDLAFFNNRIELTFDYFNKITNDLLFDRPVVATSGFTSLTQNVGELKNTGIEIGLFTKPISNENFEWNLDIIFSHIKNEIVTLPDSEDINVGFAHILREGESIGSFFLLKQLGIYQNNDDVPSSLFEQGVRAGDIIYEDLNNDGLINADDRQIVGNAFPDFYGGITNTIRYKNFDFTIFSNFSVGHDLYANYRRGLDNFGNLFNKRVEAIENRWTGPGTSTTIPRAIANDVYNNQNSTRFLEDASFFRLKTLTIGYTIPFKETQNTFERLRIFLTANNLFTITNYSGLDPETSDSIENNNFGIDQRSAPLLQTFSIGFNINF